MTEFEFDKKISLSITLEKRNFKPPEINHMQDTGHMAV